MSYNLTLTYETSIQYNNITEVVQDLQGASELDASETNTVVGTANLNIREKGPYLTVGLEKPAPPDQIQVAGDELAAALVQVGLEETETEAADAIELRA
jgi:hypothetical protein